MVASAPSDADRVGFAINTRASDIDIVVARGEVLAGRIADGDIVVACGVVLKRLSADGRVGVAGGKLHRPSTDGRGMVATDVDVERRLAEGCVARAHRRILPCSGAVKGVSLLRFHRRQKTKIDKRQRDEN